MFYLNLIKSEKYSSMPKRIILFASVLLCALIIIIVFIFIYRKSTSASNPLQAIPSDASVILQINDLHALTSNLFEKNKVYSGLNSIPVFSDVIAKIKFLDSLALQINDLAEILYRSTIYISGHFIGGRKSEFLFIIGYSQGEHEKHAIDIISEITGQTIRKTERKYEGKSIYNLTIQEENTQKNYYVSVFEGNVLVSKSVILIENAIRQYSLPHSLLTNKEFAKIIATAGKSKEANLFIDLHTFTRMMSVIANDEFSRKLKEYDNFGGWMELDLNTTDKQIILNGFIESGDQENSFNSLFSENDPIHVSVDKILPASVSSFISVGAANFEKLYQQYNLYLEKEGKKETRDIKLTDFNKKFNLPIEEIILSLIDNEISIAKGNSGEGTLNTPSVYVIVKCKSGTQAEKELKGIVDKTAARTGKNYAQLKTIYTIDTDTKFTIVEFPIENVTGLLFGDLFSISDKNFYTIIGNYLVFADSKSALGEFIYSNVLSQTLSTNEAYKAFQSAIAQNSYFLFYTNLARSSRVFSEFLHHKFIESWENNYDAFQRIQPLGMQITEVSGMNYCNLTVQYLDDLKGKPETVWESLLDTSFQCKPYLVENHYSKQKEIFIQDESNTIYLINKAGRILWKQKITEPINSKVYQVDYYRNGKLQLLFSTENYLHLIDRNGNYVERYPIRLRAKATTGMSLFDYENDRNYRIFITCNDNKVYAYTKDGDLISGWAFEGSDYPVFQPIEHFRIVEKDFIVFGDKYSVYILDRRGSVRVPVDRIIAKSQNNTFYLDDRGSLDKSKIVTTDTAGNVISIDFNGNVNTTSLGNFSKYHFFDFKDVDADGRNDYILVDKNILAVFDLNKSEILNFSFSNDIHQPPVYFNFSSSDRKIGVLDETEGKIYLINRDGSLYKGFPLEGSTLFSIGYLDSEGGVFDLIVGGRNNFLYSYSVQ